MVGTKVKVSVTIERDLLREVERLSGKRNRSAVFAHALSAWVRQRACGGLDDAIEDYYRTRSAEERGEDETWAVLGDDAFGGRG